MVDYGFVFFIAFFIWSFPLGFIRSKWRKMVYKTDSWWINIQPYFWKELKVLFGFLGVDTLEDRRLVWWFRFYVLVYCLLLAGVFAF